MVDLEQLTEEVIIERIQNGETLLYEIIVRRLNPQLYKIGRAYNYNHEDTQDLMQDTYLDAFKSLAQFEQRSKFKTWIIRIMLNNCYRKKKKMSFKNECTQENINEKATPMFSPSNKDDNHHIHTRELGCIIEDALAELSEDYRMVFSLREITGLNVSETADLLNISPSNVKVRLNRAKSMLRKAIQESYSPEELFEFNLIYCDAMVEAVMKRITQL